MPQQVTTRAKNKSRHPGAPDLPAPRRSSKVVQAERAAQEAAAMAAKQQLEEKIREVAAIKNQLQCTMEEQHTAFKKPTSKVPKTLKTQMQPGAERSRTMSTTPVSVTGTVEDNETRDAVGMKDSDDTQSPDGDYVDATDQELDEDERTSDLPKLSKRRHTKVTRQAIEATRNEGPTGENTAGLGQRHVQSVTTKACKRRADENTRVQGVQGIGHAITTQQKKAKVTHKLGGLKAGYRAGPTPSRKVTVIIVNKSLGSNSQTKQEALAGPGGDSHGGELKSDCTLKFGGLPDEDEKQWKPTSTTKTARTPANLKVPTQVIPNAPQERLCHSAPVANATSKTRPSHQSLPEGSAAMFSKYFVPLLRLYCGTLENPWTTPNKFMGKVQEFWDIVMKDWPHQFNEDDTVFRLASFLFSPCMQKIYEWRAHIGKAGLDAIEGVWASDEKYKSTEERKAYVEFALGSGLPFMYGEITHLGGDHYEASKSFLSQLILQAFASHLRDVAQVDNDIFHSVIDEAMPAGALILAVTAVERALTLYRTGVKEVSNKKSEASFLDTVWGTISLYYTQPVQKISKRKYQQIIEGARQYCNTSVRTARAQVAEKVSSEEMNVDDDRAQIAVSSDVEMEPAGEPGSDSETEPVEIGLLAEHEGRAGSENGEDDDASASG